MKVEEIDAMRRYMEKIGINPTALRIDPRYFMTDTVYLKHRKIIQGSLRPTYGEHIIIDDYGFTGSFYVPSDSISRFITHPLKRSATNFNKTFSSNPDDYYNENLQSVLYEDPDDLEFGGYSPLTDTAVYYFIENVSEFEDEDEDEEEYLDDDEDDDIDAYDILDADGLDFWLYCATLGIKLRPLDCLPEE